MRAVLWLLVLEATLAGCVVETDLARRDSADAADSGEPPTCGADGGTCTTDSAAVDARDETPQGMDGMAGMGGSMACDAHDCDGAALESGGESADGMAMP